MLNKRFLLGIFSLIFFLVSINSAVHAEVVVLVNNSVITEDLGLKEIKKIFLGKKMFWEGNQKITLFILKESPAHKEFLRQYLGKSENQFTNYWQQLLFTGKGMMPQMVSEDLLVETIKQTKGAIGYAPADITAEGVKVVKLK